MRKKKQKIKHVFTQKKIQEINNFKVKTTCTFQKKKRENTEEEKIIKKFK